MSPAVEPLEPPGILQIVDEPLWSVRDAVADDLPVVGKCWNLTLRQCPVFHNADGAHARREFGRALAAILARPNTVTRVACKADAPDVVMGFVIYEDTTLHMVYIIKDFRKFGVARTLVPENIDSYTFTTPAMSARFKLRARGWKYTPRVTWETP